MHDHQLCHNINHKHTCTLRIRYDVSILSTYTSIKYNHRREYAWAGARRRKRRNSDFSENSENLRFPTVEPKAELILQQINDKDHPDHETSSARWADCTVEIETYDEQMPHALGRQGTPI